MSGCELRVNLREKIALVTGGAKGIGEAISNALAANGASVAINYLTSDERAEKLVEKLHSQGNRALAVKADVSAAADVEQMVHCVEDMFGGNIDILVNNAGTQVALSRVEDMTLDLWNRVLAINLTGAMLCSQRVIPGMKKKGWGRVINISSISARSGGGPRGIAYASAKGGLSTFTKGLAKEVASYGITVNAIAPGVIVTEMHEKFSTRENLESLKKQIPLGRLGEPIDVVGAVLFLASDSACYVTGETIAVNGGLRMG